MLWKDNKPVYMASNFEEVEPMGSCETYNRQAMGYVAGHPPWGLTSTPSTTSAWGGMELVDNAEKNLLLYYDQVWFNINYICFIFLRLS
jgi:hypothetical protein